MKRLSLFLVVLILLGCSGGRSAQMAERVSAYSQPEYDTRHGPGYQTHPYVHHARNFMTHIGADVEPMVELRDIDRAGDNYIDIRMGVVRDGVGRERIQDYINSIAEDDGDFYPFRVQPILYVNTDLNDAVNEGDPDANAFRNALLYSRRILNDVLPPEFQIRDPQPGETGMEEGSLVVRYIPRHEFEQECDGDVIGCGGVRPMRSGHAENGFVYIPDDTDVENPEALKRLIVHELLHALGIVGHVDNTRFPDSLMGTKGASFHNLGFILPRIDREVLQVMYMGQVSDRYNDLSDWTDTSFHLMGEFRHPEKIRFGVVLSNGLALPWASGPTPERPIRQSGLRGYVTWNGALVGFTGVSPVRGDARLTVNLYRPSGDHDLVFRNVYYVGTRTPDDRAVLFSRYFDYDVKLNGNGFSHSSDKGIVTGAFVGFAHEGMVGTLKRTDLLGAFGGIQERINEPPRPVN